MKPFLVWCALFCGLYAGLSVAYHLYLTRYPRKVLVAVDTSFPMHVVWAQVPEVLGRLQTRRYTLFSLITEKSTLHTWQPRLDLGPVQPYAPRALTRLLDRQRSAELLEADQVYIVTNVAHSSGLATDRHWHVVLLQPLAP